MTWKDGEMMMAFLRTGVILLLALMAVALPASVEADGIQILTHGNENTTGAHGPTNQTPTKPEDLTAAPVLKGKHVKPALPASVPEMPAGNVVCCVAADSPISQKAESRNAPRVRRYHILR